MKYTATMKVEISVEAGTDSNANAQAIIAVTQGLGDKLKTSKIISVVPDFVSEDRR